jgi:phosphoribosylformylglycinamidine synthase
MATPKFGVVVFPGSNCDHDAYYATKHDLGAESEFLWHKDADLKNSDVVILPGGFSYGDYLRAGAVAKLSPIMERVAEFAERGGVVVGVCNGFQVLLEAGLLPGALQKNVSLRFICKDAHIAPTNRDTMFTRGLGDRAALRIPVAHSEGNYYADAATLDELETNGQIVFKYSSPNGEIDEAHNPNGSLRNVAGIVNKRGNVLGMMPHPERRCNARLGEPDGLGIFQSVVAALS